MLGRRRLVERAVTQACGPRRMRPGRPARQLYSETLLGMPGPGTRTRGRAGAGRLTRARGAGRKRAQPGHHRRARPRHQHLRRLRPGVGHLGAPHGRGRLPHAVCHALPRAHRAAGARARRRRPPLPIIDPPAVSLIQYSSILWQRCRLACHRELEESCVSAQRSHNVAPERQPLQRHSLELADHPRMSLRPGPRRRGQPARGDRHRRGLRQAHHALPGAPRAALTLPSPPTA